MLADVLRRYAHSFLVLGGPWCSVVDLTGQDARAATGKY